MNLFSKTFFRFAFGFIGIVMLSVVVIFTVSSIRAGSGPNCLIGCTGNSGN